MTDKSGKRMLPPLPHPDHLRKQAKARLAAMRVLLPSAKLAEAQALLAAEYGFSSWGALQAEVVERGRSPAGRRAWIRHAHVSPLYPAYLRHDTLSDGENEAQNQRKFFVSSAAGPIGFLFAALAGLALVLITLLAAPALAQPAVPMETAAFDKLAGYYRAAPAIMPGTVVTISRNGEHFFAMLTRQRALEIFPESPDSFFMQALPVKITFQRDSSGNAVGLVIHQGGHDLPAVRIDEATAKAIEALPPPQPKGHMMARSWAMMPNVTPRMLTDADGTHFDYWPCFSPDGQRVLFSRSRDGGKTWTLMRISTSGGEAVPFGSASMPISATRADWSKTGGVAFTGTGADGSNAIWLADQDGSNVRPLTVKGFTQLVYPSWYPDGKSVAVMDAASLSLLRVDVLSGATAHLTDRSQVMTGMPSVSPDGTAIAFAGQKNGGQRYDQEENAVWIWTANDVATIENPPIQGRAPTWSPDGSHIAFESDRGSPDGHYAVFVINRDGTGLVQVTDYALNAQHPVWSRDGKHMVFTAGDPTRNVSRIALIDLK